MSQQLLIDLLGHCANYGTFWVFTTGSDFEKLYNFYCFHLSVEPIKIITTRSTLIKDIIAERFQGVLSYARMPMKYGNRFQPTNCLVHLPSATQLDRCPFNGLTEKVAIKEGKITFVKDRWLQSFYMAQMELSA